MTQQMYPTSADLAALRIEIAATSTDPYLAYHSLAKARWARPDRDVQVRRGLGGHPVSWFERVNGIGATSAPRDLASGQRFVQHQRDLEAAALSRIGAR